MASTTSESTADFPRGGRVGLRQDHSVGPAGTRIEVLEPAGHPSGGSHMASTSESVGAANTRSGEALMTPAARPVQPRRPVRKPGSVGRPIAGVEFELIDDEWVEVAEGEIGEIAIKGHNVMKGYLNKPEATAAAIRDGWFRSGDLARRDEDGDYFIVDRAKDMIIRGGYNLYPREIDEVPLRAPRGGHRGGRRRPTCRPRRGDRRRHRAQPGRRGHRGRTPVVGPRTCRGLQILAHRGDH